MIRRPPRSTQSRSSAASDVYKRQPKSWPPATAWLPCCSRRSTSACRQVGSGGGARLRVRADLRDHPFVRGSLERRQSSAAGTISIYLCVESSPDVAERSFVSPLPSSAALPREFDNAVLQDLVRLGRTHGTLNTAQVRAACDAAAVALRRLTAVLRALESLET